MIIKVLGAAAGGGFPQWNCNCSNCASVRAGEPGFKPRTQSSLAVSANGTDWLLLNASPDLRQQINQTPELGAVREGSLRNTPIQAVVVTNGDVDHITGLINLREQQPLALYGSQRVLSVLAENSIFNVLASDFVSRSDLPMGKAVPISGPQGDLGLTVEAFDVPGKVALYLEDASRGPDFGTQQGDTIGLEITATASGKRFLYIPGCAAVDAKLAERLRDAKLVFFDGTLFSDDEMIRQKLSQKTGRRMGHISISGPEGSISSFKDLNVDRKIFVHINNSNPILDENSEERKLTEASGWEVAFDGMEVKL